MMNEIKLYKSKKKAKYIILIAIGLLFLSLLGILLNGVFFLAIILSSILSIICFIIGIHDLTYIKPVLIFNEIGIINRTNKLGIINWEIINNAYIRYISSGAVICLIVDEKYEPSNKKVKWQKKMSTINKYMGFQELNIFLADIDIKEDDLLIFIHEMIRAKKEIRDSVLRSRSELLISS